MRFSINYLGRTQVVKRNRRIRTSIAVFAFLSGVTLFVMLFKSPRVEELGPLVGDNIDEVKVIKKRDDTRKIHQWEQKHPELVAKLKQWEVDAPDDVKREISRLRSGDPTEQVYAAVALDKMGKRRARGAILALIYTTDTTSLRWVSVNTGGWGPATSPKQEAAFALADLGKQVVKPLISALKNCEPSVAAHAASALGKVGDPQTVEPLIDALKNSESGVRKAAAEALGEIGDTRAIKPLIDILKDSEWEVCDEANYALMKIDPKWKETEAVKSRVSGLIVALKDNDVNILLGAARALGHIGDTRAVEPLIELLKNDDKIVRHWANQSLCDIKKDFYSLKDTDEDALRIEMEALDEDTDEWQQWWEENKKP